MGILLRAPMLSSGFCERWARPSSRCPGGVRRTRNASPYLPSPQSLLASFASSSSPSLGSARMRATASRELLLDYRLPHLAVHASLQAEPLVAVEVRDAPLPARLEARSRCRAPMSSEVSTSILNLLPVSIPRVMGLEKPTSCASNLLPRSSAGAEALRAPGAHVLDDRRVLVLEPREVDLALDHRGDLPCDVGRVHPGLGHLVDRDQAWRLGPGRRPRGRSAPGPGSHGSSSAGVPSCRPLRRGVGQQPGLYVDLEEAGKPAVIFKAASVRR